MYVSKWVYMLHIWINLLIHYLKYLIFTEHYVPTIVLGFWVYSNEQDKVRGLMNLIYGVWHSKQVKK